jgi:hypothetical protein
MNKYFITFTEEGIFNPNYFDYTGGRMEVYIESEPYAINEIRFFTNKKDWWKFRDKWECKEVDKKTLDKVINIINNEYYDTTTIHKTNGKV